MPPKRLDEETARAAAGLAVARAKPTAERKTPQKRKWETAQRKDPKTTQVSYRGIPRATNRRMVQIAKEDGRSVGQVAALFLAYALAAYESGATLADLAKWAEKRGEAFWSGPLADNQTR